MKKLLLATTLLVASATLAQAQAVTITGEGRMGLMYDNLFGWSQENRLTLNFNVAVQADHGLTFGAWTRGRISGRGASGVLAGSRVWVEASGLRVTFGNTDGALATFGASHGWLGGCMIGYEGGTLCGDAVALTMGTHQEMSTGNQALALAMVSYTSGNYDVAISHLDGISTEVAVRARFGAVTAAAAYSDNFGGQTVLSAHYNGGNWGVGAIASRVLGGTSWALSGTANLGGGTLYGYVGENGGLNAYGLSYGYGLGGGATLTVGGERIGGATVASLGVAFNF